MNSLGDFNEMFLFFPAGLICMIWVAFLTFVKGRDLPEHQRKKILTVSCFYIMVEGIIKFLLLSVKLQPEYKINEEYMHILMILSMMMDFLIVWLLFYFTAIIRKKSF